MSRGNKLWAQFQELYGQRFSVVRDYYAHRKESVEIVDLAKEVPYFAAATPSLRSGGNGQ